ncbi:UDP-N-acetylglucosamine transferase subunit ALG13 [Pullulanibacillus pueri]|uniref:Glycosyl transferase family 28 C-terminal domain-containing protein n=1 Tax=Pullulanibacillus pueri TaxID=1437324 RepID=A0A8J3EMB9_9BACL|nr:glycosyltransferase [Pullulanibacillus pueri]MBM7681789.1 UDP-N-acetylglucosamine transferase subunit ALG13 [Pullulanibacillus pueri]GGH84248.1 hypothetical protein GCM10007096_26890 [Pullulanibacillus pueri]
MKTIAYYISDYGFGHATRSIAVIRELLKTRDDIRVIICNKFAMKFIKASCKELPHSWDGRVEFREVQNDIGYILKRDSIEPDIERFKRVYYGFLDGARYYIESEKHFLMEQSVDLVIGDVPPFPFTAAKLLEIPTIGISNFTWYTAYKDWLTEEELDPLFTAYQDMDHFLELAGGAEPVWTEEGNRSFGFYSRKADSEEVKRMRDAVNPEEDKIIVYFGLGMKIDVESLDHYSLWKNDHCVFIVSSNTNVDGENIYKIPTEYTESQNFIAAADIIISKPGWGTISEALQSDKPLIIVHRRGMNEDENTIQYLQDRNRCYLIDWEEVMDLQFDEKLLATLNSQIDESVDKGDQIHAIVEYILKELGD